MRIVVACAGLDVTHRFDLAENFTIYSVVNGIITECQSMPCPQMPQKQIAEFFKSIDVVALICNTISIDDARHYCAAGIEVVASVEGNAANAVKAYLTKELIGADEMCRWDDDDDDLGQRNCTL